MPKRAHVSAGSFVIRYTQSAAPTSGTTGTPGTRKPRSMSGFVRRSQITAMLTMKKAKSVPMFTSSAISVSGTNAASSAIGTANTTVRITGVRVRSHTVASRSGINPSRHIENATRVCP